MKTILLSLLILVCVPMSAQNFAIGHLSTTYTDVSRNNRTIDVEIYYPAVTSGENAAPADATFPPIAFGHGFVMTWSAYSNIWESLVPQGFLLIFPKTETGLAPSHDAFAKDLAFCLTQLHAQHLDGNAFFFGKIAQADCVMGHSMGGGAAVLAASQHPEIAALAVLAAAETSPSAVAAASSISVPALIFAGSNDCITPASTNQLPVYQNLQSDCKTFVSITGASHCQMSDFNALCQFGEITCSPSPDITRAEQHAVIETYLGKWLKASLLQDCESGEAFNISIEADAAITFMRNCEQCQSLGFTGIAKSNTVVFPNPADTQLTFSIENPSEFRLHDASGRLLLTKNVQDKQILDVSGFPSGIYFYSISDPGQILKGKLVKK
ncbi:T9SS type A sorting domain-containing protein [Flavobacterium sp.]|uniref:poly(ethylene terephthalate) hydrolase family protein n=1 Tax=Flavobacterium sp. TaxID=239 RepID=UPI0012274317|nr:T9SS type A sorting domain-containing protein [Flavobacterium sp.]RZJ72219.1 MAG: T9SS type A sorting domain-containing protein [Flavobacterium sp.]